MKLRWHILLILILMLFLFSGCIVQTRYFELSDEIENISMVEIHRNNGDEHATIPIITLELDEGKALVSELVALPMTHVAIGDPIDDFGYIVVYVFYQNGEADLIGYLESAKVDLDGNWKPIRDGFDLGEWSAVVIKYVDLELVPELAQFLES